jgi:hypothetical protein
MSILVAKSILFLVAAVMVLWGGYALGQEIFVKFDSKTLAPIIGAFFMAFILFRTVFRK